MEDLTDFLINHPGYCLKLLKPEDSKILQTLY